MAVSLVDDISQDQSELLSNVPALLPPPGVQPNFVNPENQDTVFSIVTSTLFGIMVISFLNRLYAKLFSIRKYSWDDCDEQFIPRVSRCS